MNFKQIIEAWSISNNPNERQLKLAELRGRICDDCDSKNSILKKIPFCTECGCPLSKKIFTNDFNPCPLKKWKEVDDKYFNPTKQKKTLV
jgi:hypothetical protein